MEQRYALMTDQGASVKQTGRFEGTFQMSNWMSTVYCSTAGLEGEPGLCLPLVGHAMLSKSISLAQTMVSWSA